MQPLIINNRYEVKETLYKSENSLLYLTYDNLKSTSMYLRVLLFPQITRQNLWKQVLVFYRNYYNWLQKLTCPGVEVASDFGHTLIKNPAARYEDTYACYFATPLSNNQRLLANDNSNVEELVTYIGKVLAILPVLHGKRVFHYNISPYNILIDEDDNVSLLDVGLIPLGHSFLSNSCYTAPELKYGFEHDSSCDVYSAGMTLYKIASGTLHNQSLPQEKFFAEMDAFLAKIIRKSTEILPQNRITLGELINYIEEFSGQSLSITQNLSYLKTCFIGEQSIHENINSILARISKQSKKAHQSLAFLVEGDYGQGKSQFLSQVASLASSHRIQCNYVPLKRKVNNAIVVFHDILRSLINDEFLFPEFDKSNIPLHINISQQELNLQTKERIAQAIIDYSRKNPLILLFDDFHLADLATVDIVKYIWNRTKDELENRQSFPRLFMVVTYKQPENNHLLQNFFDDQVHEDELKPYLVHLGLSPFSLEETGQCISSILRMDYIPEKFASRLHKVSRGNKLHIYETFRSMLRKGTLYMEEEEWCIDVENIRLPQTLENAILQHIETLPPLCEKILNIISIAQNPVPIETLFQVIGTNGEEVISALYYLSFYSIIRVSSNFSIDFYSTTTAMCLQKHINEKNDIELRLAKSIETLQDPAFYFLLSNLPKENFSEEKWFEYIQKCCYYIVSSGFTTYHYQKLNDYITVLKDSEKDKMWLAEILYHLHRYEEAKQIYYEIVNDTPSAFSFLRLAELLCEEEELTTAEEYHQKSKKMLVEKNLDEALYYFVHARIFLAKGDIKRAIDNTQKSLYFIIDNFSHMTNKKVVVEFYCKVLAFRELWEQTPYIDNFILRGKEISQQLNHTASLALLSCLLGERKKIESRYAQALESYQHSLGLWEQVKNPYQEAICLLGLSELNIAIGDYDKAEFLLERAFKISLDNHLEILMAQYYRVKSAALFAGKQNEEAEIYLDKAIKVFQKLDEDASVCLATTQLIENLVQHNDIQEAEGYISAVEKISERLKWPQLQVAVDLAKIKVYSEQNPETVILLLDRTLKICESLKFNEFQWKIFYEYGNTLRAQGNIQGAVQKYQAAKKTIDFCLEGLPQEKIESFYSTAGPKSLEKMLSILTTELPIDVDELQYSDVVSSYEESMGNDHLSSLRVENSSLKKLLDINKKLLRERDLKKLLDFIMDTAIELTKAERGFIILRNTEKAFEVARNFEKEYIENPEFEVSHSITEQVIKTGLPILSENAMEDERFNGYRSVAELNLYSILAVPLASHEKILGAVYIDNRFETSVFSEKEKNLLSAFAVQAALAVENARLIQDNIEKQKEIEAFNKQLGKANTKLSKKVKRQEEELSDVKLILHRNKQELATRYSYRNIIGKSQKIQDLFNIVDKVSSKNIPVLIQGESGTGKELVARAIHYNSPRNKENFMSENCAAISDSLLENELFGHDKGAYTNAYADKKGLFELADKGSLFLDEVGDMSPNMQVKLLRVLENNRIRRLGGKDEVQVDVRIISASNKILEELVEKQEFRGDLFFRLKVVQIDLPPLRDRKEDIPLLADHFLKMFAEENQSIVRSVDNRGMDVLLNYDWPGNIRELKNVLYNSLSIYDEKKLTTQHFESLTQNRSQKLEGLFNQELSIDEYAKQFVIKNQSKYNDSQLAKILGFSRKTLWEKRKKWSIVRG
ncbi:sigma 54-interacting transcriptional regulator [Candidatus Uabimicrobium sp. HlEnr_7]|uniref:sigma 54-interacting transcriptional regulator n=1 Tax=Candidatus Uabimicrobium helgolandensis TaxID=3095367 RepID=UPI00355832D5